MKIKITVLALMLAVAGSANAALGDSYTYSFNLPSTGTSSVNPPYPSLLSVTLTETVKNGQSGVLFNLVGNGADPSTGFSSHSFFQKLDFVYRGQQLANNSFAYVAGQSINDISYNSGRSMDSGYKSQDSYITVLWDTANKNNRMNAPDNSSWFIAGTTLDNFTSTYATANNKPSPTFGVLSATSYSLVDPSPTPSNWVSTAVSPVPEPGTWGLMLAGLGAVGWLTNRRKMEK